MLLYLAIIIRLFYWQVISGNQLAQLASDQYFFNLTLQASRGKITASDGSILVTDKNAYLLYAETKNILNKESVIDKLNETLGLDKQSLISMLDQKNAVWIPIKHKINESEFEKIKSLDLKGIGFAKENDRYYPESSMAAHLLGFVGKNSAGEDKGYFGIEGYYNRALQGKAGSLNMEKDAKGLPIPVAGEKRIPAEDGQNLELNLDRSVQLIIEEKLKQGIEKYGAKNGLIIVMDPATGGILGMASEPKYDPIKYSEYSEELYQNPVITNSFEPGSIFKPIVMAAALNEKRIDPKTKFNETGPVKIGEYSIKTWNDKYNGELTATEILEKSSNPGMVFIAQKLGKNKLLSYIQKFGFGKKTGIDLEEEISPDLRPNDDWKEIDLATASFGQGIAVTPIQMIRAIGAIANEGKIMEPQIVKKITDNKGKVIERKPKIVSTVLDKSTAKILTEMMISAVDKGDAKWAKPKGYRIAGKTGTAQIPVAGHYDEKKTIASFVGFAPADKPKFVILIALREPTSSPWGSETAAPLFFSIIKDLFSYYGLSPQD